MAKKINIVGAKPKKIEVLDRPKRRIDPAELAASLGANPNGQQGPGDMDPIALAELGTQLLNRLRSSGGRPALADATVNCRVPLSADDVKTLEAMVAHIGESAGAKPSVGQLASVIVRIHLNALKGAPEPAASADASKQDLEYEPPDRQAEELNSMDKSMRSLFIRLLSQVRSEFDRLRWQAAPIRAQLVHRATNAQAEGVRNIPTARGELIAMQGAGHREGGQRVDENGHPVFRSDPILDVKGNPITNSAGQAFDFVMPASRSVTLSGSSTDYQLLEGIVVRAGRVATNLMNLPIMSALAGWQFSTPSDFWWALLFELAWAKKHPLLVAEKRLWLPADQVNTFIPYNLQQLNGLASSGLGLGTKIPENWLKRLPDAWVSELDDVVAASVDTADYLLSELTDNDQRIGSGDELASQERVVQDKKSAAVTIRRRFAVALSFPGERRIMINKVALALRAAFGEQRVFYDKFHEEELSRPNLDLAFQRIYAEDADLVVVFICGEYREKEWCGLEWRAIRELMKSRSRRNEDVMFLRLDGKPLDGLLSIDGYLDISQKSPREVADSVIKRWTATR